MDLSRSVYEYEPDHGRDRALVDALLKLVERYPRLGFGKLFPILRREGAIWNHKRVHRVYCMLKLNIRRKGKQRLPTRNPEPLVVPNAFGQAWSMDFMSDALVCGRRFRTLNIVDDFNREVLAIEVDLNIPAQRVIRVLERISESRGLPSKIRVDNGPEFVSVALADWCERKGILLDFIEPGRPMQNSFVERFNRSFRVEILDAYLFDTLHEVREHASRWIHIYNEERPHESLGNLTPVEYRMTHSAGKASINAWH